MSNLGFSGAGGVGRPFTLQDLFGASNQPTTTSPQTLSILNRYGPAVSAIVIDDQLSPTPAAPSTYDATIWQDGVWQ